MSTRLGCVVIGNSEYNVPERLLTSDPISQSCCRRQYIRYKGQMLYYNQLFSRLRTTEALDLNPQGFRQGDFTVNEIPYYPAVFLANYLYKHGILTEYVNHFDIEKERVVELLGQKPKVVAISIGPSVNPLPLIKIVKFVRSLSPESKIIVNGLYVYNKWATSGQEEWTRTIRVIGADFYVIHIPGERTVCELVKGIEAGAFLSGVHNVYSYADGEICCNGFEDIESELDSYCIDWEGLGGQIASPIVAMSTSKGCPFHCSFCNFPIKNRLFQTATVDTLEKQLQQLERQGVRFILFNDDTFNVPLGRFKALCRMMIDKGFSFRWFSYFRLKECDEEAVALMKESGCTGVFLGLESADDTVLRNMNKRARLENYRKGLALLNQYGITSFAFFLVGFPGETEESVRRTAEFIDNAGITFFTANLWYADTSTSVYQMKESYGLSGKDFNWKHATMDSLQASDWADYLCLNVKNAIWIPNENFGFQGVPYLMSKGYSMESIKVLLKDASTLMAGNWGHRVTDTAILERMSQVLSFTGPMDEEKRAYERI
ncbi:radical SAM protein [Paenibacillus polymyxa]|uniref:Radical SAM protein n=1 Tax=Paenibacillus polymyxa TaxID=1406 RepID=A0A8I1J957_PAEPO|nr:MULTISPECIES: radical SAM protein [Paenibacillus]KAF6569869.1 radical SAM protein [Paenibacillus sp. EKM206P]KAF6585410.1 radical SAM protein [Paenibacillus sp. EKM205P]MBM0635691.1 radical SAM protein [Paenibacillus polymyxa]